MFHRRLGFTLIELLIVVAIIGILAAIAVPSFLNARVRAKVVSVRVDQKILRDGYVMFALDNNGDVPPHSDDIDAHDDLTTPIAYVARRFPDPFKEEALAAGKINVMPHAGLYHAERAKDIRVLQNLSGSSRRLFSELQNNGAMLIIGYGPHLTYDFEQYDGSNGVISQGGILTLIPKGKKDAMRF